MKSQALSPSSILPQVTSVQCVFKSNNARVKTPSSSPEILITPKTKAQFSSFMTTHYSTIHIFKSFIGIEFEDLTKIIGNDQLPKIVIRDS